MRFYLYKKAELKGEPRDAAVNFVYVR